MERERGRTGGREDDERTPSQRRVLPPEDGWRQVPVGGDSGYRVDPETFVYVHIRNLFVFVTDAVLRRVKKRSGGPSFIKTEMSDLPETASLLGFETVTQPFRLFAYPHRHTVILK